MSWSIHSIDGLPADEAMQKIGDDQYIPEAIKEYIGDGVDALRLHYGEDVCVTISGSGHLHTGEDGNWDSTTANLTVAKAEAKPQAA